MIKALLKKQFAELISQFSRKNGDRSKASPKRGLTIFIVVFVGIYASLGSNFFFFSKTFLEYLTPETFPLFYMAIGLVATAIGLFGSVFNAYSTLYEAKDNETLLSLPIPPRRIVFARVIPLLAMTFLYAGAIVIPAFIAFLVYAKPSVLGGINAALSTIPLVLLIEAITIGIAFVVAAIVRRVKHKKALVLFFSLILVGLFYFGYFRAQNIMTELISLGSIPPAARYALFFFFSMGRASQGSILDMLIVAVTGVGAFLLAYYLLSRFFVKFTTSKKTSAQKGKKGVVKSASLRFSLFKREWKIFSGSPSYIMNCAFGVIFLVAVPIVAIVKQDKLLEVINMLAEYFPKANGCAIAATIILLTEGMCCITAPTISIEGRRLYVLRALPIETKDIFLAKIAVHCVVVVPGVLFSSVTLAAILGADAVSWVFLLLLPLTHTLFTALFGLCMNINLPILDWTDEMTAVKSGVGVLISVFGTMFATLTLGGLYFASVFIMPDGAYLAIVTVLYLIADAVMVLWLRNKGKQKFEKLG